MLKLYCGLSFAALFSIGTLYADGPEADEPVVELTALADIFRKAAPKPEVVVPPPAPVVKKEEPLKYVFGGEFIYLVPAITDPYFVSRTEDPSTAIGKRFNNRFSAHPGFILSGALNLPEKKQVEVFYARLDAKQKRTITDKDQFLTALQGEAPVLDLFKNFKGSATSRFNQLYQRVGLNLSSNTMTTENFSLSSRVGLIYMSLDVNQEVDYIKEAGGPNSHYTVQEKIKFWGVGPKAGTMMNYQLYKGKDFAFSIYGTSDANIIPVNFKAKHRRQLNGAEIVDLADDVYWRVVPIADARVGLYYTGSHFGGRTNIGLGYLILSSYDAHGLFVAARHTF